MKSQIHQFISSHSFIKNPARCKHTNPPNFATHLSQDVPLCTALESVLRHTNPQHLRDLFQIPLVLNPRLLQLLLLQLSPTRNRRDPKTQTSAIIPHQLQRYFSLLTQADGIRIGARLSPELVKLYGTVSCCSLAGMAM